jgi:hypothetical protein
LEEAAVELEKDRIATLGVVGEETMQSLLERFAEDSVAQLVNKSEISQSSVSDCSPADDKEDRDEFDESLSVKLSGASVTESNKFTSQKIGLKRRVQAMRNADLLGSLLVWLISMQRIDSMSLKNWTVRARCGNYLSKSGVLTNVMHLLLEVGKDLLKYKDISDTLKQVAYLEKSAFTLDSTRELSEAVSMEQLAIYTLFRTVCTLPAMVRNFWTSDGCSRSQKLKLSRFIEERARNSIVAREMALVTLATKSGRWDSKELVVKGNAVSGEVTASYMREETSVEMKITLPSAYPLRNVDVSCTSRIGMADGRWRRWVLQIIQLLSQQDGSVVDAVLMWKCNIEKELAGVEPCPICYCILHSKTLSLPTLACPTCRNKFHSACLFTWFKSSGKSKCVICQQEFF